MHTTAHCIASSRHDCESDLYAFALSPCRGVEGNCALYEFLWACNVSMVLAVISIATHRTVLTGAALLAVAVDQVMW